jgi:hypothetical protein
MGKERIRHLRTSYVLGAILVSGCSRRLSETDYKTTLAFAKTAVPVAAQIEELFPEVDHFITHYGRGFSKGSQVWNTEAYFSGRYVLTMQVDIDIDYDSNSFQPVGEPRFKIEELSKITFLPDGRGEATIGDSKFLSLSEWQAFYESGGDVSSVQLPAKDAATNGFDRFVANLRKDRIGARLLDKRGAEKESR